MNEGTFQGLRRGLRELRAAVYDVVVPATCPGCGLPSRGLCPPCRCGLEAMPADGCVRCGEPVLETGARCGRDHAALRWIASRRAPWRYRGTGGAIVRRLKFEADPSALRAIVAAMVGRLRGWSRREGRRAVVVHVPIHPRKLRRRGFDQAARIADGVARELDRAFVPNALRRVIDTLPQGDPRVTSRAHNVEGAFTVVRPRRVRGRPVVLVDDVTTSGATARECARLLHAAGATQIVLSTAAVAR